MGPAVPAILFEVFPSEAFRQSHWAGSRAIILLIQETA
jgi:hypothetical protein